MAKAESAFVSQEMLDTLDDNNFYDIAKRFTTEADRSWALGYRAALIRLDILFDQHKEQLKAIPIKD